MIETNTIDYKSHKHDYNVYVEINKKTKLGQNLLEQYKKQAKYQYIDIGRIGYHDIYGRYIIEKYDIYELISIPKLIIRVTEKAIDRASKDVYQLRSYLSKFGQLNFLLLVDKHYAELVLIENVFIENLNHKEDYETPIFRLMFSHLKKVPLREVLYKFNIRANPDDYGKAWKDESNIKNILVSVSKAYMTTSLANKVASDISQKALVTSLNFLNKEGTFGKKVTKEYSKTVSKNKEFTNLATSPNLGNTLNNILIKTLEEQTTKIDVKDKTNFKLYKKVLDVEFSSHKEIKKEVEKENNKENLKEFLIDVYQKQNGKINKDINEENNKKYENFERLIEYQYRKTTNSEATGLVIEEFNPADLLKEETKEEFFNFKNEKIDIDFDVTRFNLPESKSKKRRGKFQKRVEKFREKVEKRLAQKESKLIKVLNAECDLNREFERSKISLGLMPNDSTKKKKKALKLLLEEDSKLNKDEKYEKAKNNILEKIEKQVRKHENSNEKKSIKKLDKKLNKLETKHDMEQSKIKQKDKKKKKNLALLSNLLDSDKSQKNEDKNQKNSSQNLQNNLIKNNENLSKSFNKNDEKIEEKLTKNKEKYKDDKLKQEIENKNSKPKEDNKIKAKNENKADKKEKPLLDNLNLKVNKESKELENENKAKALETNKTTSQSAKTSEKEVVTSKTTIQLEETEKSKKAKKQRMFDDYFDYKKTQTEKKPTTNSRITNSKDDNRKKKKERDLEM